MPLPRLFWICVLIYLGAVTHVAWDSFTHNNGWAVQSFPQLSAVLFKVAGHEVHCFGLLQYASSLLGLGLLAWWSWQWYRRAPAGCDPTDIPFQQRARPVIATAIIAFGAGTGIALGLTYAGSLPGPFNVKEFLAGAFITGADAFGLALLLFVGTVNFQMRRAAGRFVRGPGLER